jgi:hypothetical protein
MLAEAGDRNKTITAGRLAQAAGCNARRRSRKQANDALLNLQVQQGAVSTLPCVRIACVPAGLLGGREGGGGGGGKGVS